ncbi:MAG: twin-arginine translocase TatA/TatE family subunit [Acidobacteriota bacterium]
MGPLGWQETVFIFVLALLVFGPKKLPELGKTIGKALTEFRRASSELKSTWDREMTNLERETESLKEVTSNVQNELTDYSYNYEDSSPYDSGAYGSESNDSTASDLSSVSASAPEGAESTADLAQTSEGAAVEATADTEVAAATVSNEPELASVPAASNGQTAAEPKQAAT